MDEPIYVAKPALNNFTVVWMLLVLIIWILTIALAVIGGFAAGVIIFVPFFVLAPSVYYVVLPRRFELFKDRLEIRFGTMTWRIPFDSITGITNPAGWSVLLYRGMRAGGWPAKTTLVETRVPKPWYFALFAPSPDVIISASNHNAFIAELEDARAKYGFEVAGVRPFVLRLSKDGPCGRSPARAQPKAAPLLAPAPFSHEWERAKAGVTAVL